MNVDEEITPFFPLDDVNICQVEKTRLIDEPLFSNNWMSINSREFSMEIDDVGTFYACDGNVVEYSPVKNVTTASLELYLNGSVFGAILHQRKILPLHGSSFSIGSNGFILSGDSGVGKSSLTTAFCMNGCEFLTDDVTPILFKKEMAIILPCSDRIKLWDDSLGQLQKKSRDLKRITPGQDKFYYPISRTGSPNTLLRGIFIIELGDVESPLFEPILKPESIPSLQQQIYRYGFLAGMPDLKKEYFKKLLLLSQSVQVIKVTRPADISIEKMHQAIDNFLKSEWL